MNNREQEDRIVSLIVKSLKGQLGPEEQAELDAWIDASEQNRLFAERFTPAYLLDQWSVFQSADPEAGWERLTARRRKAAGERTRERKQAILTWLLAAVVAGIVLAGVWWANRTPAVSTPRSAAGRYHNEVMPVNGQRALLQLSDGRELSVSDAWNGEVGREVNTLVRNRAGQLEYQSTGRTGEVNASLFNKVSTPCGCRYRLLLPDGSTVWLNHASSIRFPVAFSGGERRVQVTGEAYVEVAALPQQPFVVEAGDTEIRALGTKFIVNQYTKKRQVLTTLLEGGVSVSRQGMVRLLKPGQQVQSDAAGMAVVPGVDTEAVSGWRQGQFVFRRASMEAMMEEIQRHYDVEILYRDSIPYRFEATVPHSAPLSKLLKMLELTGLVAFSLEGRTVTVMKPVP